LYRAWPVELPAAWDGLALEVVLGVVLGGIDETATAGDVSLWLGDAVRLEVLLGLWLGFGDAVGTIDEPRMYVTARDGIPK